MHFLSKRSFAALVVVLAFFVSGFSCDDTRSTSVTNVTNGSEPTANSSAPKQSNPPPSPSAAVHGSAVDAKGSSGEFGELLLGVDQASETVTGFFNSGTGDAETGPAFTCTFYLKGSFAGDNYRIRTWYPGSADVISGKLGFFSSGQRVSVVIKLEQPPPGCANVIPLTGDNAAEHWLVKKGDWTSVRIASAAKAFFHSSAADAAKTEGYVVKFDPVRVFSDENGWARSEFVGKKTTPGWLKDSDLFPSDPK